MEVDDFQIIGIEEETLSNQIRLIIVTGLLTDVEMETIKKRVTNESLQQMSNEDS